MTNNTELKRLAEAQPVKEWSRDSGRQPHMPGRELMFFVEGPEGVSDYEDWGFTRSAASYIAAADPAAVLALIAENEQLAKTADCWDRLNVQNKALSDSFRAERDQAEQDYKDVVGTIELRDIEIAKLRTEVAGLRTGYEAYERVNAELKAEVEGLRKDLESHKRMLLSAAASFGALGEALGSEMDDDASELEGLALELRKDAERYRAIRDDIPHVDLGRAIVSANDAAEYDAAVDAAMGKGEQS